jgi:WD40 repeat protein
LAFLASGASPSHAQPPNDGKAPAKSKVVRTDFYDDPLPEGAIARLGTSRLLHEERLNYLAFLAGDKQLLGACGYGVRLWDPLSGRELKRFAKVKSGACVALSPNGTALAVVDNSIGIVLIDMVTGEVVRQLALDKGSVWGVAWSADSAHVAACSVGKIFVWETATGKQMHCLQTGSESLSTVALAPNGKTLVAGDRLKLQLWDLTTGLASARLDGSHDWLFGSLVFAPDGKTIVGPCSEPIGGNYTRPSLRQWDAVTGKKMRDFAGGTFNGVAISADGKWLAGAQGSHIRLWDFAAGKEVRKWRAHDWHTTTLAFSRDGTTLASGGMDYRIRLWNPATGKERLPSHGHSGAVQGVAFSPDGRTIASGGPDATVRFWDWVTGRELRRCEDVGEPMLGRHWGVIDVSYAPDGKSLVSCERHTNKCVFRSWDAATGKQLAQFDADQVAVITCAADNETVIAGNWDGSLAVWELTQGKLLRRLSVTDGPLGAIALAQDGRTLAWACSSGFGTIDVKSGKNLFTPGLLSWSAMRIAISADNRLVATGGMHACLWDTATGKKLATWQGLLAEDVAFSPDGRYLAAATNKGIALWEVAAGQEVLRFTGHLGRTLRVVFAPNGQVAVTAAEDGTLLVWDMTGLLQAGKLSKLQLKDEELEAHWKSLRGTDAKRAHQAVWSLAAAAPKSVAFLGKHLSPVPSAPVIDQWVTDLDNDSFAVREKAMLALTDLCDDAEPALRRALAEKPPLELRRRVETLLAELNQPAAVGKRLQLQRALAALEYADTKEARQFLEKLAAGAAEARLTQMARASLDRLARQAATGK